MKNQSNLGGLLRQRKDETMICPICKTDITDPVKQFGRIPICQSCRLSGEEWIEDDPKILQYLSDGMSLADAMAQANSEHCRTMDEELAELNSLR
jgi:hypothetical protein